MPGTTFDKIASWRSAAIAVCSVGMLIPVAGHSQSADSVVPLTAEPDHRIRFDNGKVRIYEVVLPKGKATMWHEHRLDTFSVVFRTTEAMEQPRGGKLGSYLVRAGHVGFANDSKEPYVHRVIAKGDEPFHVMDIELLIPAAVGAQSASVRPIPPFKIALENARGRAYRLVLKPAESTGLFTRPANSGVFAISSGRISEEVEGKPRRLWDFDLGNFRWFDSSERVALRNEGTASIELVEIEIH